jgi:HD-GYP domain-containing protein (c-di-GMP phosphodiesterase class II)
VPGERGGAYRLGGDEFCLVAHVDPADAEPIIDSACAALSEHGEGFDVSTSFGAVMLPAEATDVSHALSLADERLYAQKHSRRGDSEGSMTTFLEALADRVPDLQAHLDGVAVLAVELGKRLGLRRDELEELSRAAQLHDIGKIAVPDEILHKAGPLDEGDWEFIRQHTVVGERILLASPAFRSVAAIVRSSHENWDGTGYPDGLAGEAIPLPARIIAACDAFSAMTSTRPYRVQMNVARALQEIERCAGKQFDPRIARLLVSHVRERIESERAA